MSSSDRRSNRYGTRKTDGPLPLSEALGEVAGQLGLGSPASVASVFTRWDELVGPSISSHVRPLSLVGDTLVVIVDHPAWAVQLRLLAPEILARVSEVCEGPDAPSRLEVRVKR